MGKNDHGLVHGLSCQKESDQRLSGVPRLRKWSDGVMECWSIGRIRHKIDSLLTHYSVTPVLHYSSISLLQYSNWENNEDQSS
jgi:hypothetical protein